MLAQPRSAAGTIGRRSSSSATTSTNTGSRAGVSGAGWSATSKLVSWRSRWTSAVTASFPSGGAPFLWREEGVLAPLGELVRADPGPLLLTIVRGRWQLRGDQ